MGEQRRKVRLEAWGLTAFDATRARQDATVSAAEADWEIVEVKATDAQRNPIPRRDRSALLQGKEHNRAWALYPAESDGQAARRA